VATRKVQTRDIGNAYLQALLDARASGYAISAAGMRRLEMGLAQAYREAVAAKDAGGTAAMSAERAQLLSRQLSRMLNEYSGLVAKLEKTMRTTTVDQVVGIHRNVTDFLFQEWTDLPAGRARALFNRVPAEALATLAARRGVASTMATFQGDLAALRPVVDRTLGAAVANGASVARTQGLLFAAIAGEDPAVRAELRKRGVPDWEAVTPQVLREFGLDQAARARLGALHQRSKLIAATEPLNALREANRQSLVASPIVLAAKWSLSGNHPAYDTCDVHATTDRYGYGPGMYPPEAWPFTHPRCRCYQGGPVQFREPGEWGKPRAPYNPPLAEPKYKAPPAGTKPKHAARMKALADKLADQARLEDLERKKRARRTTTPKKTPAPVTPPPVTPVTPPPPETDLVAEQRKRLERMQALADRIAARPPAPTPERALTPEAAELYRVSGKKVYPTDRRTPSGRPHFAPEDWRDLDMNEAAKLAGVPRFRTVQEGVDFFRTRFGARVELDGKGPHGAIWGSRFKNDDDARQWLQDVADQWGEMQARFPDMGAGQLIYGTVHATDAGRGRSHLGMTPAVDRELAVSSRTDQGLRAQAEWNRRHGRKRGCDDSEDLEAVDSQNEHRHAVFRHELGHALTAGRVFGLWEDLVQDLTQRGLMEPPPRPKKAPEGQEPLAALKRRRWFQTRVSDYAAVNDAQGILGKPGEEIAEVFRMVTRRDYKLGTLPREMEAFIFREMLGESYPPGSRRT